ncbi:MAG: class I SAM-dependent methyltransferase [Spirochaetales bacterium]|nr:class I SAM-dependent methyltransferase [Spirochaetales bacterium]
MPSMYEIYDHYASEYDALISHEDHENNLYNTLRDRFHWHGATIVEAGIGTGRVTRTYIDLVSQVLGFDRSEHMLEEAARNLAPWVGKLRLGPAEHTALPLPDGVADIFIEGWAFGHVAVDRPDETQAVARELISEAERVTKQSGTIVLIETLGTNTDEPAAPLPVLSHFYRALEEEHGFIHDVIRTDYLFDSPDQAEELCGFFFGKEMRDAVRARDDVNVPEFTGIWVRAQRAPGRTHR